MNQLTLTPRARSTDPQTSADAARSVTGLRPKQEAVLYVFRAYGPLTLEQLVQRYDRARKERYLNLGLPQQSPSGIRTRCSELVAMGLVRDTGERRKMSTGRMAIVWEAV